MCPEAEYLSRNGSLLMMCGKARFQRRQTEILLYLSSAKANGLGLFESGGQHCEYLWTFESMYTVSLSKNSACTPHKHVFLVREDRESG